MTATARPPVRPAGPADLDTAVAILTAALADDPVTGWVFPDPDRRRTLLPAFLRDVAAALAPAGGVLLAGGDGVTLVVPPATSAPKAVSATVPRPGPAASASAYPPPQPPAGPRDYAAAAECAARAAAVDRLFAHVRAGRRPHYHLLFNAVRPRRQNRGVCGAILRHLRAAADATGTGTYVECSTARSAALMVRHGFRVLATAALPGGGPTLHAAWRPPGGSAVPARWRAPGADAVSCAGSTP